MDGRIDFLTKYRLICPIGLSFLIHLLLLFFYSPRGLLHIFPEIEKTSIPQEKRIAFEIIETSEESRSKSTPDNTNLLSDKNSKARDLTNDDLDSQLPFSQGIVPVKTLPLI